MKKLRRKLKQVQAKLNKKRNGGGPHKKNTSAKCSKKNPGAFIPASEWRKLSDEQKEAARKARQADGISTRAIGSVTTKSNSDGEDSDDEDGDAKMVDVPASRVSTVQRVAPPRGSTLQQVPPQLLTSPSITQRDLVYGTNTRRVDFAKAVSVSAIRTKGPGDKE